MPKSVKALFTLLQREDIRQAVLNAELDTSGEIRVHVEQNCAGDALDRAAYLFAKLGMHKTELRNGVLFYLAVDNRKFAVIGDIGINSRVPENFWDDVKLVLLNHFREGRFCDGLIEGIGLVGVKLKEHFPFKKDDVNELPDEVTFGDGRHE